MITLRHAKDDRTAWKRRRIGVPSLSALSGHQVSRLLGLRVGFRIVAVRARVVLSDLCVWVISIVTQ
jgi:hypothetical protein